MRPGTRCVGVGVLVVLDALHEGGGAVADADDRDADLVVLVAAAAVRGRLVADGLVQVKFPSKSVNVAGQNPG